MKTTREGLRVQVHEIFFEPPQRPDPWRGQTEWYFSGAVPDSIQVLDVKEMGAVIWTHTSL